MNGTIGVKTLSMMKLICIGLLPVFFLALGNATVGAAPYTKVTYSFTDEYVSNDYTNPLGMSLETTDDRQVFGTLTFLLPTVDLEPADPGSGSFRTAGRLSITGGGNTITFGAETLITLNPSASRFDYSWTIAMLGNQYAFFVYEEVDGPYYPFLPDDSVTNLLSLGAHNRITTSFFYDKSKPDDYLVSDDSFTLFRTPPTITVPDDGALWPVIVALAALCVWGARRRFVRL